MALITCKSCGKSISDTTEKCVHCGALVGVEVEEPSSSVDNSSVKKKKALNFLTMSDEDQVRLEEEFWETDKEAFEWYKSMYESKIVSAVVMFMYPISFILIMIFGINSGSSIGFLIVGSLFFFAFLVIATVFFIKGMPFKRVRRKQFVYQKRFQRWLKDKKNIEYTPTIWRKSEEALFESVDIDVEGF